MKLLSKIFNEHKYFITSDSDELQSFDVTMSTLVPFMTKSELENLITADDTEKSKIPSIFQNAYSMFVPQNKNFIFIDGYKQVSGSGSTSSITNDSTYFYTLFDMTDVYTGEILDDFESKYTIENGIIYNSGELYTGDLVYNGKTFVVSNGLVGNELYYTNDKWVYAYEPIKTGLTIQMTSNQIISNENIYADTFVYDDVEYKFTGIKYAPPMSLATNATSVYLYVKNSPTPLTTERKSLQLGSWVANRTWTTVLYEYDGYVYLYCGQLREWDTVETVITNGTTKLMSVEEFTSYKNKYMVELTTKETQ